MPLNPSTVTWRPIIWDDLVLKLASLIERHLMSYDDEDLELFLDKLQERSKIIHFKEWEIQAELKESIPPSQPIPNEKPEIFRTMPRTTDKLPGMSESDRLKRSNAADLLQAEIDRRKASEPSQ